MRYPGAPPRASWRGVRAELRLFQGPLPPLPLLWRNLCANGARRRSARRPQVGVRACRRAPTGGRSGPYERAPVVRPGSISMKLARASSAPPYGTLLPAGQALGKPSPPAMLSAAGRPHILQLFPSVTSRTRWCKRLGGSLRHVPRAGTHVSCDVEACLQPRAYVASGLCIARLLLLSDSLTFVLAVSKGR